MHNDEKKNKTLGSELYQARKKEELRRRAELSRTSQNKEKGGLTLKKAKNSWTTSKGFKDVYKGPELYQAQRRIAKNLENYFSPEEWSVTPAHELEDKLLQFVKEELTSTFERRAMEAFVHYINELQRKHDNARILLAVNRELRNALLKDRNSNYRLHSEKE